MRGVHFRGHPARAHIAGRLAGAKHEPNKNDRRHSWHARAMNPRFLISLVALLLPLQAAAQVADESPLQVQDIRCTGNQRVSCDFIRGQLDLKPGARLDEEEIRNAELRLSALRYFDSVGI